MDSNFEYDENGTLVSAEIVIDICSMSEQGAVDPTTIRRYGLLCTNFVNGKPCHSKRFMEVPSRRMLTCKVCGAMNGYGLIEDDLPLH